MCLLLIIFSIIMVTTIISHIIPSTAMVIANCYYNIKSLVVRQIGLYNGSDGMCKYKTVQKDNEAS